MKIYRSRRVVFIGLTVLLVGLIIELLSFFLNKHYELSQLDYSRYLNNPYQFEYYSNPMSMEKDYKNHPYFGYTMRPNLNPDVNNHGFYNRADFPYIKIKNEVVIGIFGGSVAFWFATIFQKNDKLKEEFTKRFGIAKDRKVTVLNFAFEGGKQPQQAIISMEYLDTIDVSINIEGDNELFAEKATGQPLNYPANGFYSERLSSHMQKMIGRSSLILDFFSSITSGIDSNILRSSNTVLFAWSFFRKNIDQYRRRIFASVGKRSNKQRSNHREEEKFLVDKFLVDNWSKYTLRQATNLKGNNIPYAMFIQPTQYMKNSKALSEWERKKAFTHTDFDLKNRRYTRLIEEQKNLRNQKGINVYSLTHLFKNDENTIFTDACCHLNEEGNIKMGIKIFDILEKEKILTPKMFLVKEN